MRDIGGQEETRTRLMYIQGKIVTCWLIALVVVRSYAGTSIAAARSKNGTL